MSQSAFEAARQAPSPFESARARLADSVSGDGFFTSDLSVNEFVLTEQSGFEPLGLVLGSSVYHLGLQAGRWNVSQELPVLSRALYNAREFATARMVDEADALRADGIIGVRIRACAYNFSTEVMEFVAVGTAVRATGGGSYRTPAGRPFTSHLSGQDFWTLRQHGWMPRALVMGTCVYHVAHLSFRQYLQKAGQNMELAPYTQAVYDARELAMGRMQAEGRQAGANGVVGVDVAEGNWGWGENAIEFFALGTAVSRIQADARPAVPQTVIPLTG